MADLMCILLSFFVMLFSFANTDLVKFKGAMGSMKEALGVGERPEALLDLAGIPKRPDESAAEARALAELRRAIATQGLAKVVRTQSSERGVVVRVPGGMLFESGSDELHPEALIFLDEIAKVARGLPHALAVEGHSDDREGGDPRFPTAWHLSSARAIAALRHLVEVAGLPRERVSAVGYADTRPLVPNDSDQHRAANRRVELVYQLVGPPPAPEPPRETWVPQARPWSGGPRR
jgi:chemotaxis protein MotB